jgi:hypothetical protein
MTMTATVKGIFGDVSAPAAKRAPRTTRAQRRRRREEDEDRQTDEFLAAIRGTDAHSSGGCGHCARIKSAIEH